MKEKNINNRYPFVRFAIPFIGLGLVFSVVSAYLGYRVLSILMGLITCFIAFFFRDPERKVLSISEKEILAPADGKIVEVKETEDGIKISIFMSLLDVHVNRIPISGVIKEIMHMPGKFFRADIDKASQNNEKNKIVIIPDNYDRDIILIQIAGLIARRIICWVEKGDKVHSGQRFGLICFGSRVELFLDKRCSIIVKPEQKVKAGIDVIGYMP